MDGFFNNNQNPVYTPQCRVTKSEMKSALTMYLQSIGCPVRCVDEVSDCQDSVRHACSVGSDVLYELAKQVFQFNGGQVFYYYCRNCGVLRVYFDTI